MTRDLTVTWRVGTAPGQWSVVPWSRGPRPGPDVRYIHCGPWLMVDTCCTPPIYRDICYVLVWKAKRLQNLVVLAFLRLVK